MLRRILGIVALTVGLSVLAAPAWAQGTSAAQTVGCSGSPVPLPAPGHPTQASVCVRDSVRRIPMGTPHVEPIRKPVKRVPLGTPHVEQRRKAILSALLVRRISLGG